MTQRKKACILCSNRLLTYCQTQEGVIHYESYRRQCLLVLIATSLDILTNTAVLFFSPIAEDFGIGIGNVSLTLTICNLVYAASGMALPALVNGRNFKKSASGGNDCIRRNRRDARGAVPGLIRRDSKRGVEKRLSGFSGSHCGVQPSRRPVSVHADAGGVQSSAARGKKNGNKNRTGRRRSSHGSPLPVLYGDGIRNPCFFCDRVSATFPRPHGGIRASRRDPGAHALRLADGAMVTRDLFGVQNYGGVYPAVSMGIAVANAVGSSVIGFLYDASGSYGIAIGLLACDDGVGYASDSADVPRG